MRALFATLALLLLPASIGRAQVGGQLSSFLPLGAIPIAGSATGTTAATQAVIPATGATQVWICGLYIGSTATAASIGNATITGIVGGTLNFEMATGASPAVAITQRAFSPCVASAAGQTSIAVTSAAPGAGGTVSVTAWGYYQGSPTGAGGNGFAIGIGAIGVNGIGQ